MNTTVIWLKLRDDDQPRRVARVYDVDWIHQTQADTSADRRGDPGIHQVHLGALDLSLIVFDGPFILTHQGRLRIELLFLDGILRPQHPIALVVQPRILQKSLVTCQLSLELGQLRLVMDAGRFQPVAPLYGRPDLPETGCPSVVRRLG